MNEYTKGEMAKMLAGFTPVDCECSQCATKDKRIEELQLTLASREAAREQYLEEKLEAEARLERVREVQRYEVEPDMMEGNPPVCGIPDINGDWVRYVDLQQALENDDVE